MEYTNYASFNCVNFAGRIIRSGLFKGQYGEFLSVQLASTLTKDGQVAKITFTAKEGEAVFKMFENGLLDKGRQVTLTGHLAGIEATYEENGETLLSSWPELKLTNVTILDGGLGAKPASQTTKGAKTVVVKRKVASSEAPAPVDEAPKVTAEMPY